MFFNETILNRSGQAAVEYVLLIVVVVSLVLGLKNIFSSFNDFMNAYIGDYVVCLMEYGELPSLGVGDSDQKKHTDGSGRSCNQRFADFNFGSGRPPIARGVAQGATKSANDNASTGGTKDSNYKSSKSGGDRSEKARQLRSANKSSPYGGQINRSGGYGTADADIDNGNKKVRILPDEDLSRGLKKERYSAMTKASQNSGGKYKAITGDLAAQIEKNSGRKPRSNVERIRSIASESESRVGPRKRLFTPPTSIALQEKADGASDIGFGGIIRWLIIAAMVLGIVIFFGGQILNYSNSKE